MCSNNIPPYTSLAIVRILEQYTDDTHPISITRLRNLLYNVYGIDVSDDTVRKQVKGIIAFGNLTCPRDAGGRKVAEYDTPALFPQTEVEFLPQGKGARGKAGVRMSSRPFADAEVDFIAAAAQSVADTDPARGGDLMARIRSLQGVGAREAAAEQTGERSGSRATEPLRHKMGLTEFAGNLMLLDEAIREHLTVSFDCVRYEARPTLGGRSVVAVADGARRTDLSAYRLECVNGRYCLIVGGEGAPGRTLKAYRVDLMRELDVSATSELYIEQHRMAAPRTLHEVAPRTRIPLAA